MEWKAYGELRYAAQSGEHRLVVYVPLVGGNWRWYVARVGVGVAQSLPTKHAGYKTADQAKRAVEKAAAKLGGDDPIFA